MRGRPDRREGVGDTLGVGVGGEGALGAQGGDVVRLVLGEGVRVTVVGIMLGVGGTTQPSEQLFAAWRTFFERIAAVNNAHRISKPLFIVQGRNDPRVVEQESHELVEELRSQGKAVDYLMFEDEGHDVLKFDNRVRCYNAIVDLFKQHLKP